jgi:hypothetical protein
VRIGPREAGLAAVGCALAVAAANLLLPWYAVPTGQGLHLVFRGDLVAQGGIFYEQELLWLPLGAAFVGLLAGLAVAFLHGPTGRSPAAPRWLLATLAAAGTTLLLCGARWLGFYAARLLDPGPTLVHLHVVPYLDLLGGALLVAAAALLWGVPEPGQRRSLLAAGVAAAALVALPALPLAVNRPDGFHYDELTVEMARVVGAAGARAALDLAQARFVLLAVAVLAGVAALPRRGRPLLEGAVRVAAGLGALATGALEGLFLADAGGLAAGVQPWWNPALPLGALGLAAVALWPARQSKSGRGAAAKAVRTEPAPARPSK